MRSIRHRAQPVEVVAITTRISFIDFDIDEVSDMAHSIIDRYSRAEIDSVYIVYNEFKSVISQRVVVEKLLPIRKLGSHEITVAEEMTEEQKEAIAGHAGSVSRHQPQRPGGVGHRIGSEEVRYR